MITIRRSEDRGYFNHGWLETRHTFSFADYQDPNYMGFRSLRVINQDIVQPDKGFGTHAHRNMEILTYVIKGSVTHRDSMGNETTIKSGELQRMRAGSGVTHSEFNFSASELLEFLQIWILPDTAELVPSYEQIQFDNDVNKFVLLASPTGENSSVSIHQDVKLWRLVMSANQQLNYEIAPNRFGWLQVVAGEIIIHEKILKVGDGAAIQEVTKLTLATQTQNAEILLFDLA